MKDFKDFYVYLSSTGAAHEIIDEIAAKISEDKEPLSLTEQKTLKRAMKYTQEFCMKLIESYHYWLFESRD